MFLVENVHKHACDSPQLIQQSVKYLGHIISNDTIKIDPERISPISALPKPWMKKQVMSLLCTLNYCRAWIPDYSEISQTLSNLAQKLPIHMNEVVTWTEEAEISFECLKPCPDLTDIPNLNADCIYFVNGSSLKSLMALMLFICTCCV